MSRPLKAIAAEHIEANRHDSVACLRQMFDGAWIERLQQGAAYASTHPYEYCPTGRSHEPMAWVNYLWRRHGVFRDVAMYGPAGEINGTVLEARTVQMDHDHLLIRPARSPKVMRWHADHGWAFR